jgi:cell division protein FtsB
MKKAVVIGAIIIFFGLIGIGLFSDQGLLKLRRLRAERTRLDQQSQQIKDENTSLAQRIELLRKDISFVEKLARQKLGMIKPDEMIIKFPQDGSTANPQKPKEQKGATVNTN